VFIICVWNNLQANTVLLSSRKIRVLERFSRTNLQVRDLCPQSPQNLPKTLHFANMIVCPFTPFSYRRARGLRWRWL